MGSFGDRLKKEREQRSISLDDISLNTKIGTRLLRALEEERFEQLPGGIFNKGFVRAYARHVGLDEDQAIADYMAALGESQQKAAPPEASNEVKSEPVVENRRPLARERQEGERAAEIPWGLLALALLLVALAFASWSYYHRAPQVEKSTSAPSPTARVVTPSGTAHNVPSNGAPVSPQEPATVSQGGKAASTPIPTTDQSGPRSWPVAQAALHAAAPLQDSTTPAGMFTVVLMGNDESQACWVSIVADGQPPVEVTLVAPYEKVVQAKNEAVVKIGSAGAVDVFFNGQQLPSQGDYGVVRTLTFHADGLQPPPPKPLDPALPIPR
jgi:cytoskeleton protein RodZ